MHQSLRSENIFPSTVASPVFTSREIKNMMNFIANNQSLLDIYDVSHRPEKTKQFPKVHRMEDTPLSFAFMGAAKYWHLNHDEYFHKGSRTRTQLIENVNYQKACEVIGNFLGAPCLLSLKLNPPGFHIYRNNTFQKLELEPKHWHNDFLFGDHVESFLVPIALP